METDRVKDGAARLNWTRLDVLWANCGLEIDQSQRNEVSDDFINHSEHDAP